MDYTKNKSELTHEANGMLQGLPGILNGSEMHFIAQPILHRNGMLFGHELLLRFKEYPDPQALLKIVKHLELRRELDLHVCQMAAELSACKQDQGSWLLNIFARSLPTAEVLSALQSLSDCLMPAPLWLHILELDQVQDMPHLRKAMNQLHDSKIHFVLDVDSLEHPYSQFLPFDMLRMDVSDHNNPNWHHWLEEAQMRNVPLLAYRVESESQVHALSQKLVDYLQGFAVRDVMTLEMPRYEL